MVTKTYSVLLDTNILMSKTLRDWILLLALESKYEFFTPHVSSGIMDEFGYHVRRDNPSMNDAKIETWKQQILQSCESQIAGFQVESIADFPDENDLHVHAAAQHGGMHALVTDDRKLLNYASTERGEEVQSYETLSADDFLMQLTEYAPTRLFAAVCLSQESYARSKGCTEIDIPRALERAGAGQFARYLRTAVINNPIFRELERNFRSSSHH
ncbi:PIN domain-containing protein [Rothia sp. HMSC061D12]|uniref:PIN domain-containing protein n=1 Tax=Rothia sp. HMSC061D12 TaxID=1715161 RepID=UPI0008A9DA89|nr:PIN domain-containing protein [Rothia sp. HMSC061D12]OHP55260.1 toxin PIN [Rothia sp. HMSC061D12]